MTSQNLKPGWKMVHFGDIAENVAVRVDPSEAQTEVYVGLEHLDPETIHLREWGHPSDVTGQKLTFEKGDVIFEMILPEFLPFFLQSDMFMERAIEISVGSLSPTINWKTLRVQEFPLPPIEEQKRSTEILWAADEVKTRYPELEQRLDTLFRVTAADQFPGQNDTGGRFVALGEICARQPQSGLYKGADFVGRGVKTVKTGELFGHDLIDQSVEMERMDLTRGEMEKYSLTSNDLLFGRRSIVLEGAGRCSMVGELNEPTVFESSLLRVTVDRARALSQYVYCWFRSPGGVRQLRKIRSFTTVAGITGSDLKKVRVPLVPLAQQESIVQTLSDHRTRTALLEKTKAEASMAIKTLNESLISEGTRV